MEFYRSKEIPTILANVAWGSATYTSGTWDTRKVALSYFTGKDPDWCKKFHVWRMDWSADSINLYLDDELLNYTLVKNTKNPDGYDPQQPHLQKHYLLLNLAVGSNGGNPSRSVFPIKYEVDYVRVYQPTPTAVQSNIENKTRIFPNPVKDFIFVESDNEVKSISIYDLTGQIVAQNNIITQNKIDLTALKEGLYIAKIKFMDGVYFSKSFLKLK
jgi:beta-glucanase (GH16 family)